MATVFGCGNYTLLSTILLQLFRQDSRGGCNGIKIAKKTAADCNTLTCGSDENFEALLRQAIEVDTDGYAILNVVESNISTIPLACGDATNFDRALKTAFVNTTDDKVALKLYY